MACLLQARRVLHDSPETEPSTYLFCIHLPAAEADEVDAPWCYVDLTPPAPEGEQIMVS
jgi:hypothetical protein